MQLIFCNKNPKNIIIINFQWDGHHSSNFLIWRWKGACRWQDGGPDVTRQQRARELTVWRAVVSGGRLILSIFVPLTVFTNSVWLCISNLFSLIIFHRKSIYYCLLDYSTSIIILYLILIIQFDWNCRVEILRKKLSG